VGAALGGVTAAGGASRGAPAAIAAVWPTAAGLLAAAFTVLSAAAAESTAIAAAGRDDGAAGVGRARAAACFGDAGAAGVDAPLDASLPVPGSGFMETTAMSGGGERRPGDAFAGVEAFTGADSLVAAAAASAAAPDSFPAAVATGFGDSSSSESSESEAACGSEGFCSFAAAAAGAD